MVRAPTGASSLLLMAGLMAIAALQANNPSASHLEEVNPWLVACDLHPSNQVDLQVSACERPPGKPPDGCPDACTPSHTNTTQCLAYLEDTHKEKLCRLSDPVERLSQLRELRMSHCCERTVYSALNDSTLQKVAKGGRPCRDLLHNLLFVDRLAARISCVYAQLLSRYDCGQRYSIVHGCDDCKKAYRRWTCSSLLPLFSDVNETKEMSDEQKIVSVKRRRVRPCLRVCQDVEQQCPYLLPNDRAPNIPTQYAGEPTFLCIDPNIPETGEQRAKSSVGDEDCCYTHCGPGRGNETMCVNCPGRPRIEEIVAQQSCSFESPPTRQCRQPADTPSSSPRTLSASAWTLTLTLVCVRTALLVRIQTKWRECS